MRKLFSLILLIISASTFARSSFPALGSLYFACSGLLIEKNIVLTSGDCLRSRPRYQVFYPGVDSWNWLFKTSIGYDEVIHATEYFRSHQDRDLYNFAIIKLKKDSSESPFDLYSLVIEDYLESEITLMGYSDSYSNVKEKSIDIVQDSEDKISYSYDMERAPMSVAFLMANSESSKAPIAMQFSRDDISTALYFTPRVIKQIKHLAEVLKNNKGKGFFMSSVLEVE